MMKLFYIIEALKNSNFPFFPHKSIVSRDEIFTLFISFSLCITENLDYFNEKRSMKQMRLNGALTKCH